MATQLKPWHFAGAGILVDEDDNEFVLSAVFDDEPAGRLIAAAPDLYAAVQELVRFALVSLRHDVDIPGFDPETHVDIKRARAALAKAEGRDAR